MAQDYSLVVFQSVSVSELCVPIDNALMDFLCYCCAGTCLT